MYSKYGHPEDDYSASLSRAQHYLSDDGLVEGGEFVITLHKGDMPAFSHRKFATLAGAKAWAKEALGITHWRDMACGQLAAEPV